MQYKEQGMIIPVILAGGVGSRLWPVSRQLYPKQFISFAQDQNTGEGPNSDDSSNSAKGSNSAEGSNSLFQNTLARLKNYQDIQSPIVVCNEEHRFLVAEQLRQLDIVDAPILLEPMGRNTAPAVALAAYEALQRQEDALLLVLPADHVIKDVDAFHRAIAQAQGQAKEDKLVTYGIVPSHAETGYGYILRGQSVSAQGTGNEVYQVQNFVEKPDLNTAQKYLHSGDYYWNSGMFMFNAKCYLRELEKYSSDILEVCLQAFENTKNDMDFKRIPKTIFEKCRSDSIDYAVMEKTQSAVVIPLDVQWNDLGAWSALWEVGEQDEQNNVVSGDVLLQSVENSYIRAESRLVAAVGISDAVIVETTDAILVASKDKVQDVKEIVKQLQQLERPETNSHRIVYRPWGSYESIVSAGRFQVKRIIVNPGAALSLQMHHHRAEHWVVVRGTARVTCDDKVFMVSEDQSTYIPVGSKHRLENPGVIPIELIEVQTGSYLGEDDIVRFEDIYGR